ncbi:MAG: hypothetical protein ACWA5A_10875 [Marinibacterium sp.]
MADHLHHDFTQHRDHAARDYRAGGTGWGGIIVAAAAILLVLALVFIAGNNGNGTTVVHPGGAGAPPVVVPGSTAPALPATDAQPVAPPAQ